MELEAPMLRLGNNVLLRATATGMLGTVRDAPPVSLGELQERILTVCGRPTDPAELIEVLGESDEYERTQVTEAIGDLVSDGFLRLA